VRRYFKVAKIVFFLLAIVAIGWFCWENRAALEQIISTADQRLLIQSLLIWSILHLLAPLFTKHLFRGLSEDIRYTDAFYLHASRLPTKYLPGGIWHSLARAEGYHRLGIKSKSIAFYLIMENLISAGVTLSIGGGVVLFYNQSSAMVISILLTVIILACVVLIVTPWQFSKRFDCHYSSSLIKGYLLGGAVGVAFWIGASWSFLCFIQSMPESSVSAESFEVMGVYLLSWGIGFIALFAPQGIGVSEYVSSLLLPHGVEAGVMVALLAGFRVVVLAADLLVWIFTGLMKLSPSYQFNDKSQSYIMRGDQ
jgi:glycosyltransferase 2 family protein